MTHVPDFIEDPRLRVQYDLDLYVPPAQKEIARDALLPTRLRTHWRNGRARYGPFADHGSQNRLAVARRLLRSRSSARRGSAFPLLGLADGTPSSRRPGRFLGPPRRKSTYACGPPRLCGAASHPASAARKRQAVACLGDRAIPPHSPRPVILEPLERAAFALVKAHRSGGIPARERMVRLLASGCRRSRNRRLPTRAHRWFEVYRWSPVEANFRPNKHELWLHTSLLDSAGARFDVLRRRLIPASIPGPVDGVHLPNEEMTMARKMKKNARNAAYAASRAAHHFRLFLPTVGEGVRWWLRP